MARKPTIKNENSEDAAASSGVDLEKAIDDLRGVLKADEDGAVLSTDLDAFSSQPTAIDDFGSSDFGSSDFGSDTFGSGDFGSNDLGSSDFGGGFDAAPAASKSASSHYAETEDYGLEANHNLIMDIPIDVQIVLGSSRMPVKGLMNLKEGTTITLDKKIGEPVDITVNGRLIARGEITLLEDDDTRFGVKLTELSGASKG